MSYTLSGIRQWDSSEAVSIHGASQAMATSLDPRVVARFAGKLPRNAAYASMIAAGETGMVCYLDGYAAWCGWDGLQWRWLRESTTIYEFFNDNFSGTADDATPVELLNVGPFTLLTGSRLIRITLSADLQARVPLNKSVAARLYVTDGNDVDLVKTNASIPITVDSIGTGTQSVGKTRVITMSGSVRFKLKILMNRYAGTTGSIQTLDTSWLVEDVGPAAPAN